MYPSYGTLDYGGGGSLGRRVYPTTDTGYRAYGQGRLFLPAGVNHVTNPSFETESGTAGRAAGWTFNIAALAGTPVFSLVQSPRGGLAQRMQYTGVAGDANCGINLTFLAESGSFAQNDYATAQARVISCVVAGCVVSLQVQAATAGGGYIAAGNAQSPVIATGTTDTVVAVTSAQFTDATTGNAKMLIRVDGIHEGDTFDVTFDDACLEKSAVLTPYFSGPQTWDSMSGCAWNGTANASTSTRTASALTEIGNYLGLTAGAVACRWVPLAASGGGDTYSIIGVGTAADGSQALLYLSNGVIKWSVSNGTALASAATWSAGATLSIIGRYGGSKAVDLNVSGTGVVAGSYTTDLTDVSRIHLHKNALATIGVQGHYIGPAVLFSSRPSDADTTTFQANQAALWSNPTALVNWLKSHGYGGSLVLPLQGDSVGYIVDGTPGDPYVYTAVAATTDTGYEVYA